MAGLGTEIMQDIETTVKLIEELEVEDVYSRLGAGLAVGAGDSYAAALALEAGTQGRVKAFDPDHLLAIGGLERFAREGYVLFALSVGGRTREVVRLAREYARLGGHVVAVTGDKESPLARSSNEVVVMEYSRTVRGIGAGRHLYMIALLGKMFGEKRLSIARGSCSCPSFSAPVGHIGVGDSFSTAMFAALKSYEVFNTASRYVLLEQLFHAELYSMPPRLYFYEPYTTVLDERVREGLEVVRRAGYEVEVVKRAGNSVWSNMLSQQYCILACLARECEEKNVVEPGYRRHPGLATITRLIYHEE